MRIDWFTVGAQIFNFLVLVWLLKRFLYAPVVKAMATREKRITDRLAQAAEREELAQARERQLQDKLAELDAQREQMLARMREEVDAERMRALGAMRDDLGQQRARWTGELERERQQLTTQLRREIADGVLDVTRRVLGDLADADLERRIVDSFTERLRTIAQGQRDALARRRGPVRVASSFGLDESQRAAIVQALRSVMGGAEGEVPAIQVGWERDAELMCGVRLYADGLELGWTIDDYLDALHGRVADRLARPEA
jgi:F-type H+-transporting ATPase subunit b